MPALYGAGLRSVCYRLCLKLSDLVFNLLLKLTPSGQVKQSSWQTLGYFAACALLVPAACSARSNRGRDYVSRSRFRRHPCRLVLPGVASAVTRGSCRLLEKSQSQDQRIHNCQHRNQPCCKCPPELTVSRRCDSHRKVQASQQARVKTLRNQLQERGHRQRE